MTAWDVFVAWFIWNIGAPLAFIVLLGIGIGLLEWHYRRKQ